MARFKGIIALDIDGTITSRKHLLAPHVVDFLTQCQKENWCLLLITGRSLTYTTKILEHFDLPLYCGVQNGAAVYEFPSKRQLFRSYLDARLLPEMEEGMDAISCPLMVELGYEHGDECFYRPQTLPKEELAYVHFRQQISLCPWTCVASFAQLPIANFALGKLFIDPQQADRVQNYFSEKFSASARLTLLKDDCRKGYFIAHLNHLEANKGEAVARFHQLMGVDLKVIAGGNDRNDIEMVSRADIGIAMQDAPEELLQKAHIQAKGTPEDGIIHAVKEAMNRWKEL